MEPIYEFRPLPDYFGGGFKRYSNGLWIPDDGEYDLAFIGSAQGGYPVCLYVDVPYRENIICSWRGACLFERHYSRSFWHYDLKDGTNDWGHSVNRDNHPNEIASRSGMHTQSSVSSCCNGRSVSFQFDDKHIAAGLLRDRDTKQVFEFGEVKCHYCGERPVQEEKIKALKYAVARHAALKFLKITHPVFNECDCIQEVIEHSLCGA